MHTFLRDFLVDKLRSGKYYLDEEVFHTDIAHQGVHQISALTINKALQRVSGREQYLMNAFIHHCTRAPVDSADLKHNLVQLCDLRPWLDTEFVDVSDLPTLFEWLYKVCYVLMIIPRFKINSCISG